VVPVQLAPDVAVISCTSWSVGAYGDRGVQHRDEDADPAPPPPQPGVAAESHTHTLQLHLPSTPFSSPLAEVPPRFLS